MFLVVTTWLKLGHDDLDMWSRSNKAIQMMGCIWDGPRWTGSDRKFRYNCAQLWVKEPKPSFQKELSSTQIPIVPLLRTTSLEYSAVAVMEMQLDVW